MTDDNIDQTVTVDTSDSDQPPDDGTLTDNDDQDRLTLLMADQYFIENEALYRLTAPRNKKQDRLRTQDVRLCIPLAYRHGILSHFHDRFGHMGVHRLFLTLSERHYWKNSTQLTVSSFLLAP